MPVHHVSHQWHPMPAAPADDLVGVLCLPAVQEHVRRFRRLLLQPAHRASTPCDEGPHRDAEQSRIRRWCLAEAHVGYGAWSVEAGHRRRYARLRIATGHHNLLAAAANEPTRPKTRRELASPQGKRNGPTQAIHSPERFTVFPSSRSVWGSIARPVGVPRRTASPPAPVGGGAPRAPDRCLRTPARRKSRDTASTTAQ